MIRAVLFDFNGVIVDDEPLHFELFREVLKKEGVNLAREDYYSKYLGMDDHDCFAAALRDQKAEASEERINDLIGRKAKLYEERMRKTPPFVPGVSDFIRKLAVTHFLAVVSGALRREVEMLLQRAGVKDCINVVVAAEDVQHGKPDPEGFEKAFQQLNRDYVASSEMLLPQECLVIEDSSWGIEAATRAGMPAVGVTTSYPEKDLTGAIGYLHDFQGLEAEAWLQEISQRIPSQDAR